jgi:hypothetical protein
MHMLLSQSHSGLQSSSPVPKVQISVPDKQIPDAFKQLPDAGQHLYGGDDKTFSLK